MKTQRTESRFVIGPGKCTVCVCMHFSARKCYRLGPNEGANGENNNFVLNTEAIRQEASGDLI